jgi:hypothetical protein
MDTATISNPKIYIGKDYLQDQEIEILDAITHLRQHQLLCLMGLTNLYTWSALKRSRWLGHKNRIKPIPPASMIFASQEGCVEACVPTTYAASWLQEHWQGACHSELAIRKMRSLMASLGMFHFVPKQSGTTVLPPVLEGFNLVKAALVFRIAYRLWSDRLRLKEDVDPWEKLPAHKGMLMQELWNFILGGLCLFNELSYKRSLVMFTISEEVVSQVFEISRLMVAWFWNKTFKIPRDVWRSLIRREKAPNRQPPPST